MSLLYRLEKRLEGRVEEEIEESQKDLEFAQELMAENPEASSTAQSLVSDSIPVKLFKAGVVVGGIYFAWSSLSLLQFSSLAYLVVGFLTAKVSDFGKKELGFWAATVFWLPIVAYGLLPDRVRPDK